MKLFTRITIAFILGLTTITILYSCASQSSPSGGPYDLDPPKLVRMSPKPNAIFVKNNKISLTFDENVTLQNPNDNVIIAPPQKKSPVIMSTNNHVSVEIKDSLIPNTTYTIDFTNSIVDNNEQNPLENFSMSFATGNHVDSLCISGKVLTANDLEPVKGIYVGIHSNLSDTAFTKVKFLRISRTDDEGAFTIRGIAPGRYKIYALNDVNRSYMYNDPNAMIAYMDTTITPSSTGVVRQDTIFHDAKHTKIDSIKTTSYTHFLPDNITLRAFKSNFKRQYLEKYDRKDNKLNIYFGGPTSMPKLEALNFKLDKDSYILEKLPNNDTLTYWLKDTTLQRIDTLSIKMTYPKTDSLNRAIMTTDTLKFVDINKAIALKMKKKKKKKKDNEQQEETVKGLELTQNISAEWDPKKPIELEFSEPILDDSLHQKIMIINTKDSTKLLPYTLSHDSLNPRRYVINYKWKYNQEYSMSIDSASIKSIYGLSLSKVTNKFKVNSKDKYAQLAIKIAGIGKNPAYIELLDKSDKPVRKAIVTNNIGLFRDVTPGLYYARITLDKNNNGEWNTGDYNKKLKPEIVCYNNKPYDLKANWEIVNDEPWVIDTINFINQKPLEITKNKPKDKNEKRKQLEEAERKREQKTGENNNNQNEMNNDNGINNQNNTNAPKSF